MINTGREFWPVPAAGAAAPEKSLHDTQSGTAGVVVRELFSNEFSGAALVWHDYHETTGDPVTDRVFAVIADGIIASLARCRYHTGGYEVDGIWTLPNFRKRGYSKLCVAALVEACHNDDLYMYAVRHLTGFYSTFGFVPLAEKDLPSAIRERYTWAAGNLEGAEVQPMVRRAGRGTLFT